MSKVQNTFTFYKQLYSGVWKYCDKFWSCVDPRIDEWIADCDEMDFHWRLEDDEGNIIRQS